METFNAIASMLDIREYIDKPVSKDVKIQVLEAGRLTGSGSNQQHWRFLLVQTRDDLKKLADASLYGKWIANCNFAVIVLTDPKLPYHMIDSGRSAQAMKLAAWEMGIVSGVFTATDKQALRSYFEIPDEMDPTITVGFGYPKKITGKKKKRKSLSEVAFADRYGHKFDQREFL